MLTTSKLVVGRRVAKGASDPTVLTCGCGSRSNTGNTGNTSNTSNTNTSSHEECVLLFYSFHTLNKHHMDRLLTLFNSSSTDFLMTGKVRLSFTEGFNVTVAGKGAHLFNLARSLLTLCPWLNEDIVIDPTTSTTTTTTATTTATPLNDDDTFLFVGGVQWPRPMFDFFKPSKGCIHVFDGLSVKIVDEICPLGIPSSSPLTSSTTRRILSVPPAEFHAQLLEAARESSSSTTLVLDMRNYYESRIGFFEDAVCPPIRRFSSLPQYISINNKSLFTGKKKILTYCTGGIRCSKASPWLFEALQSGNHNDGDGLEQIVMLQGGIHNYLEWIKMERKKGISNNTSSSSSPPLPQSLFKGKNYVFDARVSLGLDDDNNNTGSSVPVSNCQFCGILYDETYLKCCGPGCHLMVVCCPTCREEQTSLSSVVSSASTTTTTTTTNTYNSSNIHCCNECKEKHDEIKILEAKNEGVANEELEEEEENMTAKRRIILRRICKCERTRREFMMKPVSATTTSTSLTPIPPSKEKE